MATTALWEEICTFCFLNDVEAFCKYDRRQRQRCGGGSHADVELKISFDETYPIVRMHHSAVLIS
jgi:hypothetical protein